MKTEQVMMEKLNEIEKEIGELRLIVVQASYYSLKQKVSLKGLLKGLKFNEEDIAESKKSLFKGM